MGLPRDTDSYESYTDQLVYFAARLEANPETASLAESVFELLGLIDADNDAIVQARRAEIRARARRDHQDGLGDAGVRRFKRRIDAVGDGDLAQRLFPRGLKYAIAPSGRSQLERLNKLVQAIDDLAASPRVAAHPEVEEIKEVLDKGKTTILEALDKLSPLVDAWEAEVLDVARAVDAFRFRRSQGRRQLGAVMGELRAKLGGDEKAAYAYTQQDRPSGAGGGEEAVEDDAPAEE